MQFTQNHSTHKHRAGMHMHINITTKISITKIFWYIKATTASEKKKRNLKSHTQKTMSRSEHMWFQQNAQWTFLRFCVWNICVLFFYFVKFAWCCWLGNFRKIFGMFTFRVFWILSLLYQLPYKIIFRNSSTICNKEVHTFFLFFNF